MSIEESRRIVARQTGRQPESAILTQVREWLRWRGWYVIRIQQGMGAHKGMSDLVCIRHRRVVFVEVKTATGKLSEHQENFRDAIGAHEGEYLVTRGIDDLEEALR